MHIDELDGPDLDAISSSRKLPFIQRTVPGHFRAITWLAMIIAAAAVYYETQRWAAVGYFEIALVGLFLAEQATHLKRPDHSQDAPSYLERAMQVWPIGFQVIGLIVFTQGLMLTFRT
jgi:hypothetical protein